MIQRILFLLTFLGTIQLAKCSEAGLAKVAFLREAVFYKARQLCQTSSNKAGFDRFRQHLKEDVSRAKKYLYHERINQDDFMPTPESVELYSSYMCSNKIFPLAALPKIPPNFRVEPSTADSVPQSEDDYEAYSSVDQSSNYSPKEGFLSSSVPRYVFVFFSGVCIGSLAMRQFSDSSEVKNIARLRRPEL